MAKLFLLCCAAVLSTAAASRDNCKAEAASRASVSGGCRDLEDTAWCVEVKDRRCGYCAYAQQQCRATCGLCTATATATGTKGTGSGDCKDVAGWCAPKWAKYCDTDDNVATWCKKTCGKC